MASSADSQSSSSAVLSPNQEARLLSEINDDVIKFIRENLNEYGMIFGARVYDENKTSDRENLCRKLKFGLFGSNWNSEDPPKPANKDEEAKQKKQREKQEAKRKALDEKNLKKAQDILDTILKERDEGLDSLYMNYVMVFYVKADKKSTTADIRVLNMFRFAKRSKHDRPSDNLFIGSDMRLYKSWADFVENNQIGHNCVVFAPAGGQFLYHSGSLDIDLYHVTRYMRHFVEPALAVTGLVGTGLLCVSLPPVGLAVGIGASGVGAVSGITRGIVDLVDRASHRTLMRTSSLLPTLDIVTNILFAHSALGALRLSPRLANSFLASERFASCLLFTENALRIGAMSRLSLDVLSTVIAYGVGELDLRTTVSRILSSFVFLYNVGFGFTISEDTLNWLVCAGPRLVSYETIQPFYCLVDSFFTLPVFDLVQNAHEFTGLFSLILHNMRDSNRLHFGNLTVTLRRLMNIKWNLIAQDLNRCKAWADKFFTTGEHIASFPNVQMAVVYNLHRRLCAHVVVNDTNVVQVEHTLELLMSEVIQLWKRLYEVIFPDQTPDVRQCTMIMQYLLDKIDILLTDHPVSTPESTAEGATMSVPLAPESELLSISEVYARLHSGLMGADLFTMSAECSELIACRRLQPIRYVIQHRYANVSFIRQQSTDSTTEEVYEDSFGQPNSFCKIDPKTRLGVLIKYAA